MPTAHYHINWDALLARIVYRWHWKFALGIALFGALAGLATGLIPPVWRGTAALSVAAAPGALVEVDGRAWPRQLYAGKHTIAARLPDGRTAWADVMLRAGETLTVTLPPGLAPPVVRPLPVAAPGMTIERVEWVDGTWRARSTAAAQPTAEADAGLSATPPPVSSHTIAFGARGTERLSTIDAYGGLADQLQLDGRRLEAVYRPAERGFGGADGAVEVRGWHKPFVTLPLSAELTLLRFAPDGAALLLGERTPGGGEQISIAVSGEARVPVVAVPGRVMRTAWSDDGRAVVLHSLLDERLSLTLVRLRPTIAAITIAETDAMYAAALAPLAWAPNRLLWISPDTAGEATLWEAPLDSLIPAALGRLDARALGIRDDGTLRMLWLEGERVVVGSFQNGMLIGQAIVPNLAPSDDLAGIWHGNEVLVQAGTGAWLVTVRE
jgi:hypothetical protein